MPITYGKQIQNATIEDTTPLLTPLGIKHIHQVSFGWVLLTAKGSHLAKSFGGCHGRGSLL